MNLPEKTKNPDTPRYKPEARVLSYFLEIFISSFAPGL